MSRRTERVAEELRGELARLLREELADPRVGLVTLTRVDVSPDLGSARIGWSRLAPATGPAEEAELERTAEGLARAAGFLRRRLAEALPLRRVPELHFRHDPSLAVGTDVLHLLRELRDDEG